MKLSSEPKGYDDIRLSERMVGFVEPMESLPGSTISQCNVAYMLVAVSPTTVLLLIKFAGSEILFVVP